MMTFVSIAFTTTPVVSRGRVYVHWTLFFLTHSLWLCLIGGPIPECVHVIDQICHIFRAGGETATTQESCVFALNNKIKWTKKAQIFDKLMLHFRSGCEKVKYFC